MASQESTILVKLAAKLSGAVDLSNVHQDIDYQKLLALANGTGANQANQIFSDTRTLASAANETLDLSGSLTNAFGESVTFTKLKAMIVQNKGTTDLTIGNAASNQFASFLGGATQTLVVPAGGVLVLTAPGANGFAVTAGTGDQLKFTNGSGASLDYDLVLIGVN